MDEFGAGIHLLIQNQGKYLLLKRADNDTDDPGCWDLPGGGIHINEQPQAAAIREAKEEAGINIKITNVLNLYAFQINNKWSVESTVVADYINGDIILSHEHSDYKWVTKEELKNIQPISLNLKYALEKI